MKRKREKLFFLSKFYFLGLDFLVGFFGTIYAGAIAVPVNPKHNTDLLKVFLLLSFFIRINFL